MKTTKKVYVMGDMKAVHICDNCEEKTNDGRGFLYWQERDFTLCYSCLSKLNEDNQIKY